MSAWSLREPRAGTPGAAAMDGSVMQCQMRVLPSAPFEISPMNEDEQRRGRSRRLARLIEVNLVALIGAVAHVKTFDHGELALGRLWCGALFGRRHLLRMP